MNNGTQPAMTPEDALKLLYGAVRRMQLPADDHDRLKQAANVLVGVLPNNKPQMETKAGSQPESKRDRANILS